MFGYVPDLSHFNVNATTAVAQHIGETQKKLQVIGGQVGKDLEWLLRCFAAVRMQFFFGWSY